jgi:hypothetical protein
MNHENAKNHCHYWRFMMFAQGEQKRKKVNNPVDKIRYAGGQTMI